MKCNWCESGKAVFKHIDAVGEEHKICKKCLDKLSRGKCRVCGSDIIKTEAIDGKCLKCNQVDIVKRARALEEVRMGLCEDTLGLSVEHKEEMSYEQYNKIMSFGYEKNQEAYINNKLVRRIWIMIKFNEAGIYDNKTISKYFVSVEMMLDRSLGKIIGEPCELIIGSNKLSGREVIDSEGGAFLVR